MKTKRQEKILQLISAHEIETQEQLLEELKAEGFQTTQATISRDIKQLRIIKELGPSGTYRYSVSTRPAEENSRYIGSASTVPGTMTEISTSTNSGRLPANSNLSKT